MKARNTSRESRSDWEALDNMKDSDIDLTDIPELDADFFRHAKVRMPTGKQSVSLRIDRDVLDWFRRQGRGYQTRMNAVLRAYVDAHRQ